MQWYWHLALDLVYPKRCPVCDHTLEVIEDIHPWCKPTILYVKSPYCMICGKPLTNEQEHEEKCDDCKKRTHYFVANRALMLYRPMAESFYRFKYAGRKEYAEFYGKEMARRMVRLIKSWKPDAIIPVPIHRKRRLQRGYNQAEEIAKVLGRELNLPVETRILKRVKNTIPQKLLGDLERQNNLKKAFNIGVSSVKLKQVILVDDIFTTGSTLDACALTLRQAGVQKVYCVCAAIGSLEESRLEHELLIQNPIAGRNGYECKEL